MYRNIDFIKVRNTLSRLHDRIVERFPESGLHRVCEELMVVFQETKPNLAIIQKPNYWLRGLVAVMVSLVLLMIIYALTLFDFDFSKIKFTEVIQVTESAVNDVILIGLAIFFLVSLETRLKRSKAINSLNELRAIAHIVDMHQLTKDPTEVGEKNRRTASSPKRVLTAFELKRYLDYCSEMLAIVGKIAALYAQELPETTVISAVNEIESLTSGISRKAWQKIMILQQSGDENE
ncbi:MAG: hypothetical protein KUG78_20355 [Kangiellaceae bacterium]|nr:hypothetical protein [Kangiellaceae bacterium]